MAFRIKIIFLLVSLLNYTATAQSFESKYFSFDDLPFIDGMSHGDFNGDSLPDFIVTASNFGKMQLGINQGLQSPEFKEITNVNSIDHTAIIDIDEDGDLDIIGRTMWNGVHLFINDGDANFERQDFALPYYNSINFTDITGDGSLEMILGTFEISIYDIDHTTFDLTLLYAGDFGNGDIGAINSKDIDSDGDLDIIVSIETSGLVLFEQKSQLIFEPSLLYEDIYDADIIEIANINNDGFYDFILYGKDDRQGKIVLSDGLNQYSDIEINSGNSMNTLTLVGDLNANGNAEIIVFENTNFNNFSMSIKSFTDELSDILVVNDHFASFGGGITDIDNDGDMDFYFFQNDIGNPGLVYYISNGIVMNLDNLENSFGVNVYPNPASEIINIDVLGNQNYHVRLYDVTGKTIASQSNINQLPLNSKLKGIYLLEMTSLDTQNKVVKKIIIE